MYLDDILSHFDNDELLLFLSNELRLFLQEKVKREYLLSYIKKNINDLMDYKEYVTPIVKKIMMVNDKLINLSNITFKNGITTKESKKYIINLLGIKYEKIAISSNISANCLLNKRFYELLDYQFLIKEKVINFVSENISKSKHINKLIIHMPTGTGKTKTAVHTTISLYQKNNNKGTIVWLAHTEELLNQAKDAFINVWSALGNSKIDIIFNDYKDIRCDNCIYFMSYQKLIYLYKNGFDNYNVFRENMSICICDEAHKCLAQETYYALEDFMISFDPSHPKTLIGLTATPGRKYRDSLLEGDNLELALMFEKHIFSINTNELKIFNYNHYNLMDEEFSYKDIFKQDNEIIKYFQDKKVLAKIKRVPMKYDLSVSNIEMDKIFNKKRMSDYSMSELKKIGENHLRNQKIIDTLIKINQKNIPTIVFACSNEQGKLLSNVLTLYGINNNCIFGDTHESLRRKYIADFDSGKYNILINNAILTTGFDSPRIKCVFITRPTNSIVLYSQMLGRGLRGEKMGGNEECLLIDIIDNLNKFNDENFAFNYFSEYWR